MFGIFKNIFGNDTNTGKIIDGISDGIDNAFYTDQEKAENHRKILDFKLKFAETTKSGEVARRFIAIVVTLLWASWVAAILVLSLLSGVWNTAPIIAILTANFTDVGLAFGAVVSWYFLKNINDKRNGK